MFVYGAYTECFCFHHQHGAAYSRFYFLGTWFRIQHRVLFYRAVADGQCDGAFAVLLPAVGSAILFHLDASSGGTDIVAMVVRKYTSINIGMALMASDALITVAAVFCFGIESGLFCILGLLMKSVLVDYVTDSFRTKKCFQIITTKPDPIVEFIIVNLHRGATLEEVYGAFHHERKTMIITVLNRAQALMLRRFIHANDQHAFMVITASTEIVGKGFLAS